MENSSRVLVTYVLNAAWQVPAVVAIATLCSWAMRRAPSQYRHVVWVSALALGTFLPLQSLYRPVPGPGIVRDLVSSQPQNAAPPLGVTGQTAYSALWFGMRQHSWAFSGTSWLLRVVAVGYLLFLCYRLARLAWAVRCTIQIRNDAYYEHLPSRLSAVVERCQNSFAVDRVAILWSPLVRGPVTLGFLRPVLILPSGFIDSIAEAEFASALCHELAHVSRHDFLLNLLYELLYLPISFHPAAVFAKERADQTRELACDERASEILATPVGYADSLLSLARSISVPSSPIPSASALGLFDSNTLEDRIMNLLDKTNRTSKRLGRILATAASIFLLTACIGAAAFSFQVVNADMAPAATQQFVGTWEGEFQGHTFIILKLREESGKLVGSAMHTTSISANNQGELTHVDGKNVPGKIVGTRIKGKSLFFMIADETDPTDTASFDFKIVRGNEAEMNPAHDPENKITTKPWKMKRTSANP